MKANIFLSEHGTLRKDVFFEVIQELPRITADVKRQDYPPATFVLNPHPPGKEDRYLYVEVVSAEMTKVPSHGCSVDNEHIVTPLNLKVMGEVWGGPEVSPFVGDSSYAWFFVTDDLAEVLRTSGLEGHRLDRYEITLNQSVVKDPKLFVFQAVGKCCERIPTVAGARNACPYCGKEPLVCQECGYFPMKCPKCDRIGFIGEEHHEGEKDPRLICELLRPREGQILEGSRWDGADFIGCRTGFYISRRAKKWMEATHAGPLVVAPARLCVDGMTDEQKQNVEQVMRPLM